MADPAHRGALHDAHGGWLYLGTKEHYAFYNGIVSPSVFSFVSVDIPVLIGLLLGGMRTRLGPIIGAAAFAIIEELVRPFGQLNVLVYGVLLIVLFVAFREGIVVLLRRRLGLSLP